MSVCLCVYVCVFVKLKKYKELKLLTLTHCLIWPGNGTDFFWWRNFNHNPRKSSFLCVFRENCTSMLCLSVIIILWRQVYNDLMYGHAYWCVVIMTLDTTYTCKQITGISNFYNKLGGCCGHFSQCGLQNAGFLVGYKIEQP